MAYFYTRKSSSVEYFRQHHYHDCYFCFLPADIFGQEVYAKLVGDLFRKDAWNDGGNIGDLQDFVKLVANVSIALAGIALATVAFVASQLIENPYGIENLVSVVMILLSVVFLFWSLGFSAHAVLAMKRKHKLRLTVATSTLTYYLVGIGLFLFFVGLLWSFSVINPLYSMIAAVGYFVIAGVLIGVSSKLERFEIEDGLRINPRLA